MEYAICRARKAGEVLRLYKEEFSLEMPMEGYVRSVGDKWIPCKRPVFGGLVFAPLYSYPSLRRKLAAQYYVRALYSPNGNIYTTTIEVLIEIQAKLEEEWKQLLLQKGLVRLAKKESLFRVGDWVRIKGPIMVGHTGRVVQVKNNDVCRISLSQSSFTFINIRADYLEHTEKIIK